MRLVEREQLALRGHPRFTFGVLEHRQWDDVLARELGTIEIDDVEEGVGLVRRRFGLELAEVALSEVGRDMTEAAALVIRIAERAAVLLGRVGPKARQTVPDLIRALGHSNPQVRQRVAEALAGYDFRPLFTIRDFGIDPAG